MRQAKQPSGINARLPHVAVPELGPDPLLSLLTARRHGFSKRTVHRVGILDEAGSSYFIRADNALFVGQASTTDDSITNPQLLVRAVCKCGACQPQALARLVGWR